MKRIRFLRKAAVLLLILLAVLFAGCAPSGVVRHEVDPDATLETAAKETQETTCDPSQPIIQPETTPPELPAGGSVAYGQLQVHFIDVGQGDAALVLCDGEAMLIDGGGTADSSRMYAYLKRLGIDHLRFVVASHAHEDHIGGLAGALRYATVDTVYCPTDSYDTEAFRDFRKAVEGQGRSITAPRTGSEFGLGSARCRVIDGGEGWGDGNNSSIVLRITYGSTSFLFTGDTEWDKEQVILESGAGIESTVLKVGHHGSDDATGYLWLRTVAPVYAVISVGEDNPYGHPTEAVLSRLRDAEVKTFRTDLQGDIIFTCDEAGVFVSVARNEDADVFDGIGPNSTETEPAGTEADYVVNKNSGKFHHPGCSSADDIKPSNRWDYHGTREELLEMGYVPCKRCDP